MRSRTNGFTLVELLVTVAIIAILCGLSLGALNKAKVSAQSAACQNNIKQLQICYQLYGDSNGDILPDNSVDGAESTSNSWIKGNVQVFSAQYTNDVSDGCLFPFNRSLAIYRCPASKAFVRNSQNLQIPHNRSYSVSFSLNNNDYAGPKRFVDVTFPSTIAVFMDENAVSIDNGAIGIHSPVSDVYWNLPSNRHGSGLNISFIDGHSEHWVWRGPYINKDNAIFSSNDTLSQRPDPNDNPTDSSSSSYLDPDAIRLASVVQSN